MPILTPPQTLIPLESCDFQLSNDRGLGVADRVFLTKYASAQYVLGCDFTEFDGAMKTQPFFVIMKSSLNSYEHFYVNGKLSEQVSSVTSCDMFCIFL